MTNCRGYINACVTAHDESCQHGLEYGVAFTSLLKKLLSHFDCVSNRDRGIFRSPSVFLVKPFVHICDLA